MIQPATLLRYQTLLALLLIRGLGLEPLWVDGTCCWAAEQLAAHPPTVCRLPAGTLVAEHPGAGWNRVVLLAKPRLASGDLDRIPRLANRYATMFCLTIMACVTQEEEGETVQFKLSELGVGYALPRNGQYVVVSSATPAPSDPGLGFVEKRVLAASEKCLADVVPIAHHDTLWIFDAKAIVLERGEHQDRVVRHAVWVYPLQGQLAMLVWLLAGDQPPGYRMVEHVMQLVPPNFVEDRQFHVKADEFYFGIPSARAFALVQLPQGQPIRVTPELATLASAKHYTAASLNQLAEALAKTVQARGVVCPPLPRSRTALHRRHMIPGQAGQLLRRHVQQATDAIQRSRDG